MLHYVAQWSIGNISLIIESYGPNWNDDYKCEVQPKAPTALEDAQRAIGLVRLNAAKWHINPNKIGVVGFSAGGYMVADISTHFKNVPILQLILLIKKAVVRILRLLSIQVTRGIKNCMVGKQCLIVIQSVLFITDLFHPFNILTV